MSFYLGSGAGRKPSYDVSSDPSVPDHPAQTRGVVSNKIQFWSTGCCLHGTETCPACSKGLPSLRESSMPTLYKMRKNFTLPDVPLESKILNITLVYWGCMLPKSHHTHTSFPLTL
eukprot:1141259-Pelagomonas_calceolata.AAC.1